LGSKIPLSARFSTKATILTKDERIAGIDFEKTVVPRAVRSKFQEPLVVAYSAGRRMGHTNAEELELYSSVDAIFDSDVELYDAEDILSRLDYSVLKGVANAGRLLKKLKSALARILPDLRDPDDIEIRAPRLKSGSTRAGVFVKTPYGVVPFSELSLGYQTVSAWTVDLAWRLFQQYPASSDPLSESAIVLIDEIDLHLHPKWQREIRVTLSAHFPNVQFIATAHSPLMAQTYLDANLAVVRRDADHVVIVNDPVVVKGWRLDQIMTSELFGMETARAPEVEAKQRRRLQLLHKARRTRDEERELRQLDSFFAGLPIENTTNETDALRAVKAALMP
jgi:hypothetical protein